MRKLLIAGAVALGWLAMMAPMSRAALLANESFDDDTTGAQLFGQTGGTGWNTAVTINGTDASTGWFGQSTGLPNYEVVAPGTALTYSGLSSGPDYAIGGFEYQTIGRTLDVSSGGAFNSYLNSNGYIGKSGTTLYMSVMMREDETPGSNGGMAVSLFASSTNTPWETYGTTDENTEIAIGDTGNGKWSLDTGGSLYDGSGTITSTGVSITEGQTYLMVLEIQFNGGGGADVASLWVDPTLGGSPGAPTLTEDGTFQLDSFAYYGGTSGSQTNAIDEIRFGNTFGDVTPSGAILSAVPLPAAAWSGLGMLGCLAAFGLFRRRVAH
jgi:hypothetical protein